MEWNQEGISLEKKDSRGKKKERRKSDAPFFLSSFREKFGQSNTTIQQNEKKEKTARKLRE